MIRSQLKIAGLALIVTTACGGDSFSEEDAQTATQVVVTTINNAVAAAPKGLTAAQEAQTSITLENFEYQCSGGGTVTLNGTVGNVSSGSTGSANVDYDLNLAFAGCTEQGLTIGGDLQYRIKVDVAGIDITDPNNVDPSSLTATFDYLMAGTILYGGDVIGECVYDLRAAGSSSGAGAGSYQLEGSACGVDVETLQQNGFSVAG